MNSKFNLIFFLILIIGSGYANAQSFTTKALTGYTAGINSKFDQGIIMPRESINYLLTLGYEFENGRNFDISFIHQPTSIKFKPSLWDNWQSLQDFNLSSIHLGYGFRSTTKKAGMKPFGIARLGPTFFSFPNQEYQNFWLLTAAIETGVKIPFSDKIALLTQINYAFPLVFGEKNLFTPTNDNQGFSTGGGIKLFQLSLNTGFLFKF
jgi:hypothetical protein